MRLSRSRALFLPSIAILCAATILGAWAFMPVAPHAEVRLTVKDGSSLIQVANQLEERGIIRSALAMRLLARLQGKEGAIHAGTYSFSKPATPFEILARLVNGDVDLVQVTIPEGFNLEQIAARLAEAGLADHDRLIEAAHDPQLLQQLAIHADSLEGYLFPETYRFVPGISEPDLLRMMVRQFRDKTASQERSLPKEQQLDEHQLVTLASIIQKETGIDDEMPLIASVFHNRLRRGIPLQTDPTVIYGIKDFDGNLTRRDLKNPTPYNTYLIKGLPPGPIASPGLKALHAAANPADTDFLYFVARGDGSHQFSKTLREHNRAVRRYQLHRPD